MEHMTGGVADLQPVSHKKGRYSKMASVFFSKKISPTVLHKLVQGKLPVLINRDNPERNKFQISRTAWYETGGHQPQRGIIFFDIFFMLER